jgi:hypothetical protein
LYLKKARAKRLQAKRVKKKSVGYCFIGIGHKKPGAGGGGVECA